MRCWRCRNGEPPTSKLIVIAVIREVLFFLALTRLEAIPDIPVDIDREAFSIPCRHCTGCLESPLPS
jgi:hypothetical protein